MALILVVDDDHEINDLIAVTLKVEGYEVRQAHNGEAALRMAQEHAPDLILLDVMMPRMSGIEVAHALHLSPKTNGIPIIFVTADSEPKERAAGLAIPQVVDYVCKPFDLQELVIRLRNALASAFVAKGRQKEVQFLIRNRR
ncbi:MAG TPA: response regulator [Abditibacteriaceae bacterium]|jgi:DNA-binding response OmpR family regulator